MNTSKRTEISSLGEFGLIERLTKELSITNKETVKGTGDDAAILQFANDEEVLVTTDLMMEGIHFDLTYFPLKHLGYKAVVAN
ncbi:MAG: thiamine-phosphate kinase, partial [Bacteroidaceae bacterium]|nr:thiamine-phosphate kinase [Bacteroidaceae bacterium]